MDEEGIKTMRRGQLDYQSGNIRQKLGVNFEFEFRLTVS